ncbi:MAG TPA: class D beta-lactamase [Chitinophagaceae bacterium]|nr:class D beta-lactamase [Chitinophagaceae bacterium]
MIRITAVLISTLVFFSCTINNVKHADDLKKYFDEFNVEGTFAMYDNSRGQHTIYNLERDTVAYSPASTFKIVNALVALQTGRITSDSSLIKWDGITRERPEWNQDLSLYHAFRVSAVPHFQSIARSIGRDTMQRWLDSLRYGNMKIGPHIDSFWLDNSLKVSNDAQVWLAKLLYFRQLPVRQSVQEEVKKMMIQENNTVYQLAYKTGWGATPEGHELGWVVGWIEENRHVYFFSMNFESPDHQIDMANVRKKLLTKILTHIGFFQGKM